MKSNIFWDCEEDGKCYIRNALTDWAIFNECFSPTRIMISDIDGVVERYGQFLFIEVKQNKKSIPAGQKILFENLTRNAPHISVLVLFADYVSQEMNVKEYAVFKNGKMTHDWTPTNTQQIKDWVTRWFQRVNQLQ